MIVRAGYAGREYWSKKKATWNEHNESEKTKMKGKDEPLFTHKSRLCF